MDDRDCHDIYQRMVLSLRRLSHLDTATRALENSEIYVGDIRLPLVATQKIAVKVAVLAGLTRIETVTSGLASAVPVPGKIDPYVRANLEMTPALVFQEITDRANKLAVLMQQFEPAEQPDGSDRYTLAPADEQTVADLVAPLPGGIVALSALLRARVPK